jgi:hypothetical protein
LFSTGITGVAGIASPSESSEFTVPDFSGVSVA